MISGIVQPIVNLTFAQVQLGLDTAPDGVVIGGVAPGAAHAGSATALFHAGGGAGAWVGVGARIRGEAVDL
jgi:hypothetical protein